MQASAALMGSLSCELVLALHGWRLSVILRVWSTAVNYGMDLSLHPGCSSAKGGHQEPQAAFLRVQTALIRLETVTAITAASWVRGGSPDR